MSERKKARQVSEQTLPQPPAGGTPTPPSASQPPAGGTPTPPSASQPPAGGTPTPPSASQPPAGGTPTPPSASQPPAGGTPTPPSASQPPAGGTPTPPSASQPPAGGTPTPPSASQPPAGGAPIATDLQAVLDRAAAGGRITPEEALDLYRSAPLHALGSAADAVRRRRYAGVEHIATYIIERNINYTNVCVTACKFCAFYVPPKSDKGWSRDLDEILRRCAETVELGGTQIMFQGGHHPDYGVEYYERAFSAIKAEFPQLVIHSLGASEVEHMARISGVSIEEAITRIHRAGLDSFAGAGAELLPERPRKAIAPLKESGERWLEIMETAHGLGVESTSTMLMGTGETNAERIEHLRMIRDVQDRTGGFRAFIPYTYQPQNNHLKGSTQATVFEYLRMIAIARLFLDNVAHIQGSWLTTGKEAGQLSLHYGADDLGSVMLEENVVSAAGAKHRSNLTELIHLIRAADRVPAQRSTTYQHLRVLVDPADDPVDPRVASHIASTAIEGGTAHPELKILSTS